MGMLHAELFAAIAPFPGYLFPSYWDGPQLSETRPSPDGSPHGMDAAGPGTKPGYPASGHSDFGDRDNTWQAEAVSEPEITGPGATAFPVPDLSTPTRREGADGRFPSSTAVTVQACAFTGLSQWPTFPMRWICASPIWPGAFWRALPAVQTAACKLTRSDSVNQGGCI